MADISIEEVMDRLSSATPEFASIVHVLGGEVVARADSWDVTFPDAEPLVGAEVEAHPGWPDRGLIIDFRITPTLAPLGRITNDLGAWGLELLDDSDRAVAFRHFQWTGSRITASCAAYVVSSDITADTLVHRLVCNVVVKEEEQE